MAKKKVEKDVRDDPRYHDTRKLLKMYRNMTWSLELLRTRHKKGEMYYWILSYAYLSPQQFQNTDEIIEQLRPHIRDINFRTYFRRQKEAIEAVSSILWGYASQDTLNLLRDFPQL